ncbi:hypothetical protein KI387_043751 [Taxus chinensis]|uniref:RNase H type-1 domain-containing protein n=1 Tax=Taxus chinensis TaxID=29808 RepID=A0AA38LNJ3_TAXCH|nr:hypothetical protein KI387_043751 [Taxus chinensis]
MCFNGALTQALMVTTTGVEGENSQENSQQQETFKQQSAPNDTTLVNWQAEDFCGMNQAVSQGVAANTRSKRRNLGEEKPLAPANPQPSMAPQMIGKKSPASNAQGQPRTAPRPTQMPAVAAHIQGVNVQTKGQQRDPSSPFSIIDQMKKTNVNISMWESLSIPGQRDLLQAAMKDWLASNQQMKEKVLTNAAQSEGNHGGKQVHNCMIDSGASSSVMPKQIVDQLGLQYETTSKGVVQLDGTAIATVRVIRNLSLTLHACPNVVILQDASVIDLPPLFALCLSRDFTAKIGGYLFADWSHMLFRTRYGTKATIRSEPITNFHIEPYTPSQINVNCSAFDQEDHPSTDEADTKVGSIPDLTLDEWANKVHAFDTYQGIEESELGVYCINEESQPIPSITKPNHKDDNEVWQLFFDGSRSRQGAGGGAVLVSPQGVKYYSDFRFQFACSNNTAEYEALVQGMHWAIKKKIKNLQVFGDSELIVNQVKGQHAAKNDLLRCYKNRVCDLMEDFEGFGIKAIPRKENQATDRLAAIGAAFDIVENIQKDKVQPNIHMIVRPSVPDNDLCQEFPDVFAWSYEYLKGFNPNLAQHTIELDPNTKSVRQKQRPVNPHMEPLMRKELDKLIESRIIFPIKHSSWVANLVPVRKKSGEIRLCVDFRDLNRASLKDHYPLPSMEQILQVVAGSERFSLLDGYSGFNQIMVKEEDQFKIAFTTKWGTYAYKKIPFVLSNAGATFQRAMDMAFKRLDQQDSADIPR